uniref:T9SS type A sorting domain-containing protein n=1 Tax=Ignavibacterium sp. TaxID=2651167 RepID=UPI0025B88478
QANLKGTQLSNNPNAYSKGSQRKFIRITNGRLFAVYESMGNIYLERSTDNGASWEIFNNTVGKRLNSYPAHSPSIDFYNVNSSNGDVVLVTFVEDIDAATSRIMVAGLSDKLAAPLLFTQEVSLVDRSVQGYGNPVIACSGNGKFIIAFKGWDNGNYGIFYRRGIINNWQLTWVEVDPFNLPKISNTNNNSLLPTIAEDRNTAGISYQLAWEQSGAIRYCKLVEDANGNIAQTNHSVISNGSSYIFHSSPSIIAIGTGARVCWLGWNDTDPIVSAVVFKDPANSRFWSFGNNVSKPNINKSNDNTYYAFGWSQNNSTVKFADNSLRSVYEIIGITGKDVQISNGNGKTNMFANIFKAASQPYFFTMSNNLNHYYSIQKSNGMLVSSGRTGVIRKNGGEVYFALGDITVNNQKVEFVECSPETDISNISQLNQYLETEAFEVTDNSGFEYTVQYGIVDTSLASGMFGQGEQVRFKVELIDNNSGELLGVFDDVVYDQNNLTDFENILYQVNTQGIGQRTVKLRLKVEENINPVVSMVDRIDNEGALAKGKRKELKYEGETIPKEFALNQNYPNPFNPTTVISWQSPVGSHQTLKIYDVLGNEVATLVDEYREAGRHKVEFDASSLASGVYIYKLTAGSFTSSKKMMVIK